MAQETRENVVYVGNKPVMNYVLAVITQFNNGSKEVSIRARGKAISRAVDVAEVVRNKFITDVQLKEVKIGTETVQGESGEKIGVSSIEIVLTR